MNGQALDLSVFPVKVKLFTLMMCWMCVSHKLQASVSSLWMLLFVLFIPAMSKIDLLYCLLVCLLSFLSIIICKNIQKRNDEKGLFGVNKELFLNYFSQ